ncbi:tyrosine-protein kinase Fyn-like [Oppia nitens]|uniref:tyrosine-protein kinase Fyn-like n=1 Tax=Oppia nitens TaxID=1686743 RepID=UPI0023DC7976|nr:tyrosine-protein kinase Fyn-like [Oppia nitens]
MGRKRRSGRSRGSQYSQRGSNSYGYTGQQSSTSRQYPLSGQRQRGASVRSEAGAGLPVSDITSERRQRLQQQIQEVPHITKGITQLPKYRTLSTASSASAGSAKTWYNISSGSSGTDQPSQNIIEDLDKLRDIGFNIDYPNGLLGEGYFGQVYRGTYGPQAEGIQGLPADRRFAVKIIDFGDKSDDDTLKARETFETEKYILTEVNHPNVVVVRMAINMGTVRSFPFRANKGAEYLSPERVYLFMDFADKGDLQTFVDNHWQTMTPNLRINWIIELFSGMLYLHSNDIIHGDIHCGNVLLYSSGGTIATKWTDFGLGYVARNRQYRFRADITQDIRQLMKNDVENMGRVIGIILDGRWNSRESPQETQILDTMKQMRHDMNYEPDLRNLFEKYKHVLAEELTFQEDYY